MGDKPALATVPVALKRPCDPPAELPDRALSSAETGRLWGRDRAALGECRVRHAALAQATEAIEGQGQ